MSSQYFINVVVPFDHAHSAAVEARIRHLADPTAGNCPAPAVHASLRKMQSLHFMSVTVAQPLCPAESDGSPRPASVPDTAHLLLECSADEGSETFLPALAQQLQAELLALLGAAGLSVTAASLPGVLRKHQVEIGDTWGTTLGQVFSGSPGMSAGRIQRERRLADHVEDLVRQTVAFNWSPRQRLEWIRDRVWNDAGNWKWAFVPEPATVLAAAPDRARSMFNRQIWKAAASIFLKLFGPVLAIFITVSAIAFAWAWRGYGLVVALMWVWYVMTFMAVLFGLTLLGALLRLRVLERTDDVESSVPSSRHGQELLSVENFDEQNHLASVSRLKGGLLRRFTLRLAFVLVGTGRYVCAPGFLGKNGVIHFARWMRLPGTSQLLFWSNYDGTWESYVADFIADAPTGVTAIWSNCVGFPRSRALVGGGAEDRNRLVLWARRQQHPTHFWYSAYRGLTAARIRINAAIRQGLASAESQQDCEDWLALFGSAPRLPGTLQVPQISTLVFGALSDFRHACCIGVAFGPHAAEDDCRALLRLLRPDAGYGETTPGTKRVLVAGLSARGLARLGLPEDAIETFPLAFKQGMSDAERARALGDVDPYEPAGWNWGGPGNEVDVFIAAYADRGQELSVLLHELDLAIHRFGHRKVLQQPLALLRSKHKRASAGVSAKEPFGFTDGVSQPIIRGAPRWTPRTPSNNVVEAGEFVLGYPDNTGVVPVSPSLRAGLDPDHVLPDAEANPFRKRPEFSSYEGVGRRDLGSNGTFLVVRQLEQQVQDFENWFQKDALAQLQGHVSTARARHPGQYVAFSATLLPGGEKAGGAAPPPALTREAVRAKMMGRWPDGVALVRDRRPPGPHHPDRPRDNDFMLGAEDPSGQACPFGAHIRRANPRDTRFPGDPAEISAVNRHRLLRVGRIYGELDASGRNLDPGKPQGLMFMCLNADIERQFEFVQKTWLLNPSLHGLSSEVDPIIGRAGPGGSRGFTIPTPTGPLGLTNLPDFTKVRGGGYFFIPGQSVLDYLCTSSPAPPPPSEVAATAAQGAASPLAGKMPEPEPQPELVGTEASSVGLGPAPS